MKLYSWGSKFTIEFAEVSPTETRLTIGTHEAFALTGWDAAKRRRTSSFG